MAFCAERAAYAAVVEKTSRQYHQEAARIRREAKIVASEQVRLQLLDIAQQYDLLADNIEWAGLYRGHPTHLTRGPTPGPPFYQRLRQQFHRPPNSLVTQAAATDHAAVRAVSPSPRWR